uniref:Uncharacterized protein n=1 Tax=viral metagenome TaxID=1070528 RepID=A0A6C0LEW3_9ZZZZ
MSNKKIFFILIVSCLLIITVTVTIGSLKEYTVESFTPGLQKIYRPYLRSWRVYTEKKYDEFSKKKHVILSKFGII